MSTSILYRQLPNKFKIYMKTRIQNRQTFKTRIYKNDNSFFFFKYFAGKMDSDVKSAYIQGTFNTTHWVLDNQQLLPFTHWGSGEPRLQYPGFVNIKVSKVSGNYYWQTAKGLRPLRHVFCGIIV